MNFTLCVLLVNNDNGFVQTARYTVFAQTHFHHKNINQRVKLIS